MVPDITGGALCPRVPEPPTSPHQPSSSPTSSSPVPPPHDEQPLSDLRGEDDIILEDEEGGRAGDLPEDEDEDDDDDEEMAAACSDDVCHKRLSMESGYSASEKHLEEDVVAVEMREQQHQLPLLDQSELPSERLSLPSSQTDGKLANRDSGIDSISSPSHSEELCFAGVEDGGVVYQCSPALLPRLSSSSSYAGEGEEREEEVEEARGGVRRRQFTEEGDSDLEEEDTELTLVLPPPKTDRQDSAEVSSPVCRGPRALPVSELT